MDKFTELYNKIISESNEGKEVQIDMPWNGIDSLLDDVEVTDEELEKWINVNAFTYIKDGIEFAEQMWKYSHKPEESFSEDEAKVQIKAALKEYLEGWQKILKNAYETKNPICFMVLRKYSNMWLSVYKGVIENADGFEYTVTGNISRRYYNDPIYKFTDGKTMKFSLMNDRLSQWGIGNDPSDVMNRIENKIKEWIKSTKETVEEQELN